MTYIAKRQNNKAIALALTLTVGVLTSAVLSAIGYGWRAGWQLLTMLLLVAIIQIAQRYFLSCYEYILDAEEELYRYNRLTVVQVVGRRRHSVFTVPLASLVAVIPYRGTRALTDEYGAVKVRMSFCTDLRPRESYLLLFENNGSQTVIRLQCDAKFAEKLRERAGL